MDVENKFTHSRDVKFSSEFELKYFQEEVDDSSSENRAFSLIIEGIDKPGLLYPIGADRDEMLLCVLHIPPNEEEIEMHAVVSCIVRNHGDGQSEQVPDLTLTDGETDFCIYWKEAVFNKGINPIELRYCYTQNLGGKFSLENLENGSREQAREMLSQLDKFKGYLNFKQKQKGGRPRKSRTKKTREKYIRLLRHRYSPHWRLVSDREFLEKFPQYKRGSLQRAKNWDSESRP